MALLGSIIWILIGIGYVIYKGFQEERESTLSILKTLALIVLPAIFVAVIAGDNPTPELAIVCVLIWIIEGIIALKVMNKKNGVITFSKSKEDKIARYSEARIKNLDRELLKAGYHIKWLLNYDKIKETVADVVRREEYAIPLYNRKEDRPSTISEIYECLSKHQRHDLYIMGHNDDQSLSNILGVELDCIPINKNATREDVYNDRVRELHTYARQCDKKWSDRYIESMANRSVHTWDIEKEGQRQRKVLMIKKIMSGIGLKYPDEYADELPTNKKYINEFEQCFSKKQKIKKLMEEAGYHLNNDIINRITYSDDSPINSIYVGTPAVELYKWICKVRTTELERMSIVDKEKFEQLLGIKLVEIPLSDDKVRIQIRLTCAIMQCLGKEGLEIDEETLKSKIFVYSNAEQFERYKKFFIEYLASKKITCHISTKV